MRNIVIIAAVLCALGVIMGKAAGRITPAPTAQAAVSPAQNSSSTTPAKTGPRTHHISRDGRGHYQAYGRIANRTITFLVDTGASVIALRSSEAARIGVRVSPSDFTASVSTANGTVRAARARIPSVEIGDLMLRDVDALVLPDTALSENLLGMSFLGRLKRFEIAAGTMVLHQ
jgi:aspartyl protease family protein